MCSNTTSTGSCETLNLHRIGILGVLENLQCQVVFHFTMHALSGSLRHESKHEYMSILYITLLQMPVL
jgi:hypothetical protein